MNNRILIGSPVYGKVDSEILMDWMRFAFYCGRFMPEYEFELGIKSKTEQFRARNAIVEGAQQFNCDRILMIDDDMVIDWNNEGRSAYGFLQKLIAHDKDICGIRYYQRGAECAPVLMKTMGEKGYRFMRDDEIENALQRVDVAGGGCLLIKTKVFDRIAHPYFAPEHEFGTDIQLCKRAAEKGFEVWADTAIEFGHLRDQKSIVNSHNRHLFMETAEPIINGNHKFVATDTYTRLINDAQSYTAMSLADMEMHMDHFLLTRNEEMSDPEWYRMYPAQRIGRQVVFNVHNSLKKQMTQFILNGINHNRPLRILDFGCGIGITAFALAEKGHQVTAMDIRGTGTFEFLKWRSRANGVPMTFIDSEGGPPQGLTGEFDVIIAMDSIEHIADWGKTIEVLSQHLRPDGLLYANNAILDDMVQPEHYELHPSDFIKACVDHELMPYTQISYIKKVKEALHA